MAEINLGIDEEDNPITKSVLEEILLYNKSLDIFQKGAHLIKLKQLIEGDGKDISINGYLEAINFASQIEGYYLEDDFKKLLVKYHPIIGRILNLLRIKIEY